MNKGFLALMLLSLLASGCAARSGMGTAVVTQRAELPCFGVASTRATREGHPQLQAVSVSIAEGEGKGSPVWRAMVAPAAPRVPLPVGQCVQYGAPLPEGQVLKAPQPLAPGRIYSVMVNAVVEDPSEPVHLYTAHFCMVREAGASARVLPVERKEGKLQAAACGPLEPSVQSGAR